MVEGSIGYWYHVARGQLEDLAENPQHEALLLCERFFGFSGRAGLNLLRDEIPDDDAACGLKRALCDRPNRPLQYILGEWPFMGRSFYVGEGVLCPREDTRVLVDAALEFIRRVPSGSSSHLPRRGRHFDLRLLDYIFEGEGDAGEADEGSLIVNHIDIIDLCAGSGIVGLSLVQEIESAGCTLVELSENAAKYLDCNISRYGDGRASRLMADVLKPPVIMYQKGKKVDIIVSNPPYIPADKIENLSREVRQEPKMALDGGADGLLFYRAILENWLPLLRPGGLLAVEIGFDQSERVKELFGSYGLCEITAERDFAGVNRVIHGTSKQE